MLTWLMDRQRVGGIVNSARISVGWLGCNWMEWAGMTSVRRFAVAKRFGKCGFCMCLITSNCLHFAVKYLPISGS